MDLMLKIFCNGCDQHIDYQNLRLAVEGTSYCAPMATDPLTSPFHLCMACWNIARLIFAQPQPVTFPWTKTHD